MASNHDFIYMSFGELSDLAAYQIKPTVCLMIVDYPVEDKVITSVVHSAISVGCTFFMVWGKEADTLHDLVDEVIESGSDEWLNIITTSHVDEPLNDVLDFLFTGAMPGDQTFRCLIVGDRPVHELRILCPA